MNRRMLLACLSAALMPAFGMAARLPPIFEQWPASPYQVASQPEDLAIGDFNDDGILDVAASSNDGYVSLLLGQTNESLMTAPGSPFAVGAPFIRSISTADFDGDGKLDVAGVDTTDGDIISLTGNGAGALVPSYGSPFTAGVWSWHMAVGDFNNDHHPDAAIADPGNDTALVALNEGSGNFPVSLQADYPVGANPVDILVVDLNNDGYPDLATANYDADTVTVLLNDGTGHFVEAPGSPVSTGGYWPERLASGDYDEDGNMDVVCVNQQSASISILRGDGTGKLALFGVPTNVASAWAAATADMDGDGHQDVVVVGQAPPELTVLRGNGHGDFEEFDYGTNLVAPDPYSIRIADVDKDGHDEILVSSFAQSGGLITVLRNERIFGDNFD